MKKVKGYTLKKTDNRESAERKRKKWYIRVCRDERIPKRIAEHASDLGCLLAKHNELTNEINSQYSCMQHFIKHGKFLKKATYKDYDKYWKEYENITPKQLNVKEVILTDEMVTSYIEKRLGMRHSLWIDSEFKRMKK